MVNGTNKYCMFFVTWCNFLFCFGNPFLMVCPSYRKTVIALSVLFLFVMEQHGGEQGNSTYLCLLYLICVTCVAQIYDKV